jgi:hypothetical protein
LLLGSMEQGSDAGIRETGERGGMGRERERGGVFCVGARALGMEEARPRWICLAERGGGQI